MKIVNTYRLRRNEGGQAIMELVVSMIAIMSVVLGFILISTLSVSSVEHIINAREEADIRARQGVQGMNRGKTIQYWDYGKDNLPFSTDDSPVTTNDNGEGFAQQLISEVTGDVSSIPQIAANSLSGVPQVNNFASDLSISDFFVNAANLSCSTKTTDPLKGKNIPNLRTTISKYFGVRNFNMKDTLCMPLRQTISYNEM